ncbi:MAG: GNAT family N-acetyltransferase [Deltaproteobacteria bacterium]|nr:GNAT family N-acetyltransferase [Deltaproteobacteria bacterium]
MLAYEGTTHVGQLQFRPYVHRTNSPNGLHHPLYWMDFEDYAPQFPERTLAIFCYHVGQLDNTAARDSRYFGRGLGTELLGEVLTWAASAGFEAVVAKGCPNFWPIIRFMGGMPTEVYEARGFTVAATYEDRNLRNTVENMLKEPTGEDLRKLLKGRNPDDAARVSICVKTLA